MPMAPPPQILLGSPILIFQRTPEQAHHFHEDDLAVIMGEGPKFIPEETFKDIHGNIRYLQTTKIPFQFGPAKVPALLGVAVDITERKQAEEVLMQERNLLRSLIDHVPDYIYVKDTQGRFLTANPALARLMAAGRPDELLGKTDFDFYPQKLAARFYADEQTIFQSGQPVLELEEPSVDTAGNERWVSTTKVPLKDAQGKIFGLVGMSHDITERKQREKALHQHITELETLYESGLVMGQLLSPKEIAQKLIELMSLKVELASYNDTPVPPGK